jgi:hypothetical protein
MMIMMVDTSEVMGLGISPDGDQDGDGNCKLSR